MRLVFAGTPEIAETILAALLAAQHEVLAVLTQPDRKAGRGQKLQASPVKVLAEAEGIPVFQPTKLKDPELINTLRALAPQVMVVVAYGLMVPEELLHLPRDGCWNVHVSLLPRWRGAAPIQRAIEAGDMVTGVSIMQMDAGLDTGPILLQRSLAISPEDTALSLHELLADLGAEALLTALELGQEGKLAPRAQSNEGVTYAHKLSKTEGRLDFSLPAMALARKVRAFYPWPMTTVEYNGILFKIGQVSVLETESKGRLGQILAVNAAGITVQTALGRLRIETIQQPGAKMLSVREFLLGHPDLFVIESEFT